MPYKRVYVKTEVGFSETGKMRPKKIIWENGDVYEIDRVGEIRPAASLKAGGQGDRYLVYIKGLPRYLFFERSEALSGTALGRWFVEGKA